MDLFAKDNNKPGLKGIARAANAGGLVSLEICAGGGGQSLGLERAGFAHAALVENDPNACHTLRVNRPEWNVVETDARQFSAVVFRNAVDLLAGGVPCPPFSKAGKQLGKEDERDLFPEMIRLADECRPKAVMIENVRGLLDPRFDEYRHNISEAFGKLGYAGRWRLLRACDYGVSQLRPRTVFVALRKEFSEEFAWPGPRPGSAPSVGELLFDLMNANGWSGAQSWRENAADIAPTLVGGSKKHGGADLGPTRARQAWAKLGVDGRSLAGAAPGPDFSGLPKLTTRMTARVQGFPDDWQFYGRKTVAYRQIGNAFPPQVAEAVGAQIAAALQFSDMQDSLSWLTAGKRLKDISDLPLDLAV